MAEENVAYATPGSGNAGQIRSDAVNGNVHGSVSDVVLNGVMVTMDNDVPVRFVFPDGASYERNLEKFPKDNGYNPVYFTNEGEVRLISESEFSYLKTRLPDVTREDVFYRKDYLDNLDRLNNISRDADGMIVRGSVSSQAVSSVKPVPIPKEFGSDEWNARLNNELRVWRGIDGLAKTVRFPDGSTFKRDMDKWPKSNGYNLAVFTINGEVRLTTREDMRILQRLNPMVKPENVAYRKDFIKYMDYEMGVLRDSDGKLIDVRPQAERGHYDEILYHGMTLEERRAAAEKNVRDAAEIADAIADNDRRNSQMFLVDSFGHKIGYHGELDADKEFSAEFRRDRVLAEYRMVPDNENTRKAFEMEPFTNSSTSEAALDILADNFNENYLADTYIVGRLAEHYDALGDFYTQQVDREDLFRASVSSSAARDALAGAYAREELVKVGYDMSELRTMSTKDVVSEFNSCIKVGLIDQTKGGNLDMAMYKASQKQCEYISKNWDTMHLPANFTEKYTRKDVALDAMKSDDAARKVEYLDAKEAFAYNNLMIHLKPYVTENAMAKITTAREALKECKKYYENIDINASPAVFEGGKVNKLQAKELKAHGEDPKAYTTYEAAKAKIDTFEPTKEQVKEASKFMKKEEIAKFNRGDLAQAIFENKKAYAEHMHAEVSPEIRKYAEEKGLARQGQAYTNSDWAKDSLAVAPMRSQLGYVHHNCLEKTVEWYAKSQAEKGNSKFVDGKGEVVHSSALYEAVKNLHERRVSEQQNSPMDSYQAKFFKDHGWEVKPETTWKQANEAMLTTAYMEGLVGRQNHKFMQEHDNVISRELKEKLFKYDMNEAERADVRKEVNEACNMARKAERLGKIESVSITDNSVYGSARNFANDYMIDHRGSLKGVEDAMVKAYADGNITFPDERMVAEKSNIPSLAVGHVMASVLPDCVGDYSKSVERFSDMYEAAVNARAEKAAAREGKPAGGPSGGAEM